ncbi:hypothetical protein OG264_19035 [Streptomyces xanthophaeus]|uniref:hypothetical protein n=1 Tax=Streptomyces xanthophaeus TaxID=67385 RepID=UPI003867D9B0|nr:hypothetical protein OG264_19035 [Streptomyces xanthophaeus]WST61612.1 hypothetical protein OG605_19400 [Streptomyces xanthophaeus]
MKVSQNALLPPFERRTEYFDYFSGNEVSTVEQLEDKKLAAGLQKSYILETVDGGNPTSALSVESLFERSGLRARPLAKDNATFEISTELNERIALLEKVDNRYLALYTLLPSNQSDKLVRTAVASNPFLDHLWLSSQSFLALWARVLDGNSGRRYGKITFEHESIFEVSEEESGEFLPDERRTSRFTMVDKLEVMSQKMNPLQQEYAPLASITQMRLPAQGRGGHDLYYDGKVTNRSGSFIDHRAALHGVIDMYRSLTRSVERQLWTSVGSDGSILGANLGSVAEIVFSKRLPEDLFRRWIMNMFNNRRNRFRLTGYATWLSDVKVHANAIDQHLWQPLTLELTPERVVAVLPFGTCGNSVNRLVSNIQRFIDPRVTAYIGDREYGSLIPAAAV